MTDRELLELAAKAAGMVYTTTEDHDRLLVLGDDKLRRPWDPLTDDADALRLAVKLGMFMRSIVKDIPRSEYDADPYTATRRAITRAAAEIGKAMP